MNSNSKNIIMSIVAVTLIAILVSGGTYAYWTWVSNTAQNTAVNFTVQGGDKTAVLTGNGSTTAVNMKPARCDDTGTSAAIVKTVPIVWTNNSTNDATVTATLSVTAFSFRSASYKPTTTGSTAPNPTLGYLRWAVRESAVASSSTSACNPDGNDSAKAACNACATSATASGDFTGLTIPSSGTSASGLPLKLTDLTFTATANNSGTKTYYLYIWLDYNYPHQNTGNVNDDPMQGLNFTVKWTGTMV